MELQLTEKSQQLLELLMTIPPNYEAAKTFLDKNALSEDEVTQTGIIYADKCFWDYSDYCYENWPDNCILSDMPLPQGLVPELHSAYLYDVVALLLRYGLNPNAIYKVDGNTYNMMSFIMFIDHEYVSADTLRLLLENGGDPNLRIDMESAFEEADFEVWFGAVEQEVRWRYDAWVHTWMVLLAYGGEIPGKGPMVETFREYGNHTTDETFDLKKLRNHRQYFYGLTKGNPDPVLHIFDRNTLWEVARV